MSGLAKFFVVLNLVLALFFLGVSATLFQAQKDWKSAAEKALESEEMTVDRAREMKATLQGKIDQTERENESVDRENVQLSAKVNDLQNTNGDLRKDVASLEAKIEANETRLAQKDEHIQDKRGRGISEICSQYISRHHFS